MITTLVRAALILLATSVAAQAAPPEAVSFPGSGPSASVTLPATFYRVGGRAPAIVLLHPCNGETVFETDWSRWFVEHGYSALVVDSFKPRGVVTVCTRGGSPTLRDRGFDALGALAWLRTQPDVDGTRIFAIGWSHGGGAALLADAPAIVRGSDVRGGGFRGVIGLYPPCQRLQLTAIAAPLLMLLGGNDEWRPPQYCDELAARLSPSGPPVKVHTYPGVTHAFDNPNAHGTIVVDGRVVPLRFSPEAAADAHDRILSFLGSL